jgi:hypothetical protein
MICPAKVPSRIQVRFIHLHPAARTMSLFGFGDTDGDVDPFGDLVEPAPIMKPHETHTDFDGLLDAPIKLHEDLAKGCGGQIWPAGDLLTKYILRKYKNTDGLRGKRILELGAGGGMTSWVSFCPGLVWMGAYCCEQAGSRRWLRSDRK